MIISILIALVVPFIVLFIIWQLEIYAVTRMHLLLATLLGGVAAFALSYILQTALLHAGIFSRDDITLISSPILEETFKLIPLAWLAWRMKLRYAADGT